MKLKKIKVFGFKTFADRTELDIDGNIIAVVGPNGCGKSNIVDSILWGLGETNARSLRAQTAKEVIFSGSRARKPLGYADISLIFDNEDQTLPIETAEVSISRKVTRGGDSQFKINGRNCRLRDISDLLADSGLGKAGYAIVGQSEIDQALAASAIQRRAWVDEAAGVQRYRARRNESLRRLESARQHLERVHDIILEIEIQREPLAKEAEDAKRYRSVQNSLREVETSLLISQLAQAVADVDELEAQIVEATHTAEEENKRSEQLNQQSQEALENARALEEEFETLRENQSKTQSELDQTQADLQVAKNRLESLDELRESLEEESTMDQLRLVESRKELELALKEEAKEAEYHEKLKQTLSSAGDEADELSKQLKEIEASLAATKARHERRQKLELEAAHKEEQSKEVTRELAGIEDSLPDLNEAVESAELQMNDAEKVVQTGKNSITQLEHSTRKLKEDHSHAQKNLRELLTKSATLDGRRRGLEATLAAHEGLATGAQSVMELVEEGRLQGDYIPVAEAIEVQQEYVLAIEAGLGGASNDLIVPDEAHAKNAIEILKSERLGRATFQPVTLMRTRNDHAELTQVLRDPAVVGRANELVDCDDRWRPVIDSLLSSIIVVESLDDALKLARTKGWRKLVTLDGEIVFSGGAVTGGQAAHSHAGILRRKTELAEVINQLELIDQQVRKLNKSEVEFESKLEELNQSISKEQDGLVPLVRDFEEARNWYLNLKHELTSTLNEKQKLTLQLEQLSVIAEDEEDGLPDLSTLESERDKILRMFTSHSVNAEAAQERMKNALERLAEAKRRTETAQKRLNNLEESKANRSKRSENIEPEKKRYQQIIQESTPKIAQLEKLIAQMREDSQKKADERRESVASANKLAEEARVTQRSASAIADKIHKSEVSRARADSRRTNASQKLLEEYGISEVDAIKQAPEIEVPEDAPALVSKLRKDIKSMGEVNLGAIEAYERLTERYDELTNQVDDIEESITGIQASVSELDRLTEEKFTKTFEQLQVAFSDMFSKIFGGGEGVLEMSDTDNILDSGVEIGVTIPGKRRQRLELLSGGERALSALAFLFALLKVNPTPLVILDEVDAPLDGRNVEKFITMLKEFNDQTQFILITHNNVTIESADVWFGVTMQEPGVSTVIPYRVPPKAPEEEKPLIEKVAVGVGKGTISLKG